MRGDQYQRGEIVRLLAYRGEILVRRVWADVGRGVVICDEAHYQQAIASGVEPLGVGWPREDILEIVADRQTAD